MADQGEDRLDARLRSDAGWARAHEPAPDFEPVLDRALARRRRTVVTWVGVAAVVVLGGSVVAGVALGGGRSGSAAGDGSGLRTMTDAGFSGAVLDPADPRRLEVLVMTGSGSGPCALIDPVATATVQTATSVTVRVSGQFRPPKGAPATGYFGFSCASTGYRQVPVELDAPLGQRTLYDGADPVAQPVLDPSAVPTPGYVPSGYHAEPVTWEPDYVSDVPPSARPGLHGSWAALRRYRSDSEVLDVRIGRLVAPDGTLAGTVQVSGHRATLAVPDAGGLCVTWLRSGKSWSDPDRLAVQVCSGRAPVTGATGWFGSATPGSTAPATVSAAPTTAPLREEQLLQVARSLPRIAGP